MIIIKSIDTILIFDFGEYWTLLFFFSIGEKVHIIFDLMEWNGKIRFCWQYHLYVGNITQIKYKHFGVLSYLLQNPIPFK